MGDRVKLLRVPGGYETLDGRYLVERQDNVTECSHPLCDTLHRRWHEHYGVTGTTHHVLYVAWHVWDNAKDDYADHLQFDSKRDAVSWLTHHVGGGRSGG